MTRGRKPKANAIRRGGTQPIEADVVDAPVLDDAPVLQKPDEVALNQTMSKCWDVLVGSSPNFQACDIPLLVSYCYWYAVLLQCQLSTITEDGCVITTYGQTDDLGQPDPFSLKPNPDIKTAERATVMLRQLGDVLNLTPTARDRNGLMQAMTKSTQADVVRKTAEGFAEFKKRLQDGS